MATAGERLVAIRERTRLYDIAVKAARIKTIGLAFTDGAVMLEVETIEMVEKSCREKAAASREKAMVSPGKAPSPSEKKVAAEHREAALKHEADRKLVELENLEDDGYKREQRENGTVSWRGPWEWPGIPQRPPPTRLDGAQTGAAGGGGGGGSGGPAPRPLTLQERLDAQAWEAYYEWLADETEWTKRQKRRGWVVGEFLLPTVMTNPQMRRVFRESGVERAEELFQDGWPGSADSSS